MNTYNDLTTCADRKARRASEMLSSLAFDAQPLPPGDPSTEYAEKVQNIERGLRTVLALLHEARDSYAEADRAYSAEYA